MERFDFFMERFPVCHGADVRLTVQFPESTVEFPDLTGFTRFTGLVLRMDGGAASGMTALDRQSTVPSVPSVG